MVYATLTWQEPIDLSDVKRALEIERELGSQRPLDGQPTRKAEGTLDEELILEGPRDLEPVGDLQSRLGPHGRCQPGGA